MFLQLNTTKIRGLEITSRQLRIKSAYKRVVGLADSKALNELKKFVIIDKCKLQTQMLGFSMWIGLTLMVPYTPRKFVIS